MGRAVYDLVDRAANAPWKFVARGKIVDGSRRNVAERRRNAALVNAVYGLIQRSVAAAANERVKLRGLFPRNAGDIAFAFGKINRYEIVAGQQAFRDIKYPAFCFAVSRSGIDDE